MLKMALLAGSALVAGTEGAAQGSGIDLSTLLQYGPLGIFAVIFVIFAETSYKRETQRSDRMEAENLRLNTLIQEKFIPALEKASHAMTESSEIIRDIKSAQRNRRASDSDD